MYTLLKFGSRLVLLGTLLLTLTCLPLQATAYLFTSGGAGAFGITAGGGAPMTLALNGTVSIANSSQVALGLAASDKLTMTGGTITGPVDFADTALTNTLGSCPADSGGICKVNTGSSLTAGSTITGVTQQNLTAVNSAVSEWNGLVTGWSGGAVPGVDLSASGTICTGSFSGCTLATVGSPSTRTVNGVLQTAYVFNITSTTIGGTITIKGDSTALIILQYSGSTKLTTGAGSKITLTGGVRNDQVLLDDTGSGGIDTSAGFNYSGAMAVSPSSLATSMSLNSLVMSGQLYVNNITTVNMGNGFGLTTTPEPNTTLLIGGALVAIAFLTRKVRG